MNRFKWLKIAVMVLGVMFVSALLFFLIGNNPTVFLQGDTCDQAWFKLQMITKAEGSCRSERFMVNGQPYDFVDISHDTGMDCLSGCITQHYYGLVDLRYKIVHDFFELRNPFEIMRYGKCASFQYAQDFKPYYERRIIKQGQQFFWELLFRNFDPSKAGTSPEHYNGASCNMNGSLIIKSWGNDFDDSQLTITPQITNCQQFSIMNGQTSCVQDQALNMNDASLCPATRDPDQCYRSIALQTNNVTLCADIQEKSLSDSCYARIVRDKNDNGN